MSAFYLVCSLWTAIMFGTLSISFIFATIMSIVIDHDAFMALIESTLAGVLGTIAIVAAYQVWIL